MTDNNTNRQAKKEVTVHRLEEGPGVEFEATLDGRFIGYFQTRAEADEALNAMASRRLQNRIVQGPVERCTTLAPTENDLSPGTQQVLFFALGKYLFGPFQPGE